MKVSVVIPVYNERENLAPIHASLKKALSSAKQVNNYEIIFVDDGSTDGSLAELQKIKSKNNNLVIIVLRRNFGQSAAINAGLLLAKNEIIITMDADLQNNPADIPKLLRGIEQGYDIVSGWRVNRKDALIGKKIPSRLSNWLARKLTGLNIHDFGCSLKAYRKESVQDLKIYGETHRYIPALLSMKGFKVGEVRVTHKPRMHGKTKYGLMRLFKGLMDLAFIKFWSDFSTHPLHFFGLIGLASMGIGSIIGLLNITYYLFIIKSLSGVGPLLLLAALLIILGFQLVSFGFLAEIIIRNYYASENESPFYIKKVLK